MENKHGQPQRHGRATLASALQDQAPGAAAFFERDVGEADFFRRGIGPAMGFMVRREPVL